LNDITNIAVSFSNNPYSSSFNDYQIKCRNNIIRNAKIGISIRETYNSRLHVRNNNIGNTGYIKGSVGIDFVNTYQTQTTCDKPGFINRQFILSNKITRFETGINTEQANCMVVDSNLIRMSNNFGFFTQFHGIWSKNCTNGEIGLNDVNGGNLSPSSCIGIRLLSNNTERVFCSTVDSNDYAIWMEGAGSFTTRMEKNTLSKYNNGFYFTGNLSLNHQLINSGTTTPLVQINAWIDKTTTGLPTKEFNASPGLSMTDTNFYFLAGDPNLDTRINDIHQVGLSPTLMAIGISHLLNCNGTAPQGRMLVAVLKDSTNMHWDTISVFGLQTK